jgi:hypothetical protein
MATYSHESEMALFHECTLQCAQKGLDTADIVREGFFNRNLQCYHRSPPEIEFQLVFPTAFLNSSRERGAF